MSQSKSHSCVRPPKYHRDCNPFNMNLIYCFYHEVTAKCCSANPWTRWLKSSKYYQKHAA